MRKVIRSTRMLIAAILEVLIELDRRTDLLTPILDNVLLNDDDTSDYDDEEAEEPHFGMVSVALTLAALPVLAKGMTVVILMLQ